VQSLQTNNFVVEIKQRMGKIIAAYNTVQNIWRSKIYSTKTKVRIYESYFRTVLLYWAKNMKDRQDNRKHT
jgi:glycogen synthase